jgi:V/A-type H+-transporting ATPase subunit A
MTARIVRVQGSIAEASPLDGALNELCRVGERGLLAEIVRRRGDRSTLQIHEDATGLRLGEPVVATGALLEVELGPGLLGSVLDGIGRPLAHLARATGDFLEPGASAPTLDRGRRWSFQPGVAPGDTVRGGDVLGTVDEGGLVHRVLAPPGVVGRVDAIGAADAGVDDPVGRLDDGRPLLLHHRWPVRRPRPAGQRLPGDRPLVTGQRVLDFLFPVAEGGTVSMPGGFGTGKTVLEQGLARFASADVVVFVGCGERGNEMAELLQEFPNLSDPRTGRPLSERTVLVVNTSNMPVVAREASVYLGLTVGEYFRDTGLRVAVLVDSLSRWAEALRDIGSRLQEMPGEEGYPTYLGSRLAALFERAGRVEAVGRPAREGAVSLVCAVSPPGGDFSEPVTQSALRVSGALWALDPGLAHQRQFPAVDTTTSYSLHLEETAAWFTREAGESWHDLRRATFALLQRESELREVAGLLGAEALQDRDRLVLEIAALAREHLLGQDAYDPNDQSSPVEKTLALARAVHGLHRAAEEALGRGLALDDVDLGPARAAIHDLRRAPRGESAERVRAAAAAVAAVAARRPS